MKTQFLTIFILLSLLFLRCNSSQDNASQERPNVILFFIDDYGYGDISKEGNTQIQTPNIDRIANQGARFTRFYQSSGACAPTRASLLTGRYYLETGVWGVHFGRDFLLRDETTIANVLQKAGYATGAFGKWHSGKIWSYYSWNRGFDVGIHPVLYQYWNSRAIYNNKLINFDGPVTDVVGDQVIKFIQDNREGPFFAYVPFQSIHEPFNCPDDVFEKYKSQGYSNHVARMYGMIEVLDYNIGKITKTVQDLGLEEKTVLMFAVDDGPSPGVDLTYANRRMVDSEKAERERGWGRKLRGSKANIYEGGSVSPFYIQWKGRINPGLEYNHLSGVIDLFPTILEICNVEIPEDNLPIRGQSLIPVLNNDDLPEWDERMYFDNTNFYRIPRWTINMDHPEMREMSVHYKNFKLIRFDRSLQGKDTVYYELYDLDEDPQEETNVYADNPDIRLKLRNEVERWYEEMLGTGRAFGQAVFEVGNWDEKVTPINLDAVKEISGTVKKSDRSEFRFDGWTTPGSSMTFDIDVVEDGEYQVELIYDADQDNLGSEFLAFTEFDTATIIIDDEQMATSTVLDLPRGPQELTIKLKKISNEGPAVDVMKLMLVHRIFQPQDTQLLRNPGFIILNAEDTVGVFSETNSVADLRLYGRRHDDLVVLNNEVQFKIHAFCDNPEQIEQVDLFVDFNREASLKTAPFEFDLELPDFGKFTINVEFISKGGIKHVARAYVTKEQLSARNR